MHKFEGLALGVFFGVALSCGCTKPNPSGKSQAELVGIPVSYQFICKLAWYVDELDNKRFASRPDAGIKGRLARLGIATNGIWDVVYSDTLGKLFVRGPDVPESDLVAAFTRVEQAVPSDVLDAYEFLGEGMHGEPASNIALEYDEHSKEFGIVRKRHQAAAEVKPLPQAGGARP